MFKCIRCNKEFESFKALSKHTGRTHKISSDIFYIEYILKGNQPICKCGCGQKTNYRIGKQFQQDRFADYIQGHHVKGKGFYTKEGIEKSVATNRKQFLDGREQWNKGVSYEESYGKIRAIELKNNLSNNKERGDKISKALTGKPKSEIHRRKLLPGLAKNRKEILKGNPSKLEHQFARMLDVMCITYDRQYELNGLSYDFKIKNKNILIEVDGDYYHSNPDIYDEKDLNNMQKKNRGLDKLKSGNANHLNYKLLRFWEYDIKNNRAKVIQTLLSELKI
jgi:very-short-patch-repair endonuclease